MNFNQKSQYKIGAYVRVSTEEQAENPEGSIKNQEMRLRDYVKMKNQDQAFGEIKEVFTDAGISAKDMKRPSLQRLLAKIKAREINLLLVTELSRLTRSTKDFSLLWEFMNEHGCKFLSLRDNFDSTTPAGEMIMFTLANFAQFERKQTAEFICSPQQARSLEWRRPTSGI
jgi:site-specific DNA recombinase